MAWAEALGFNSELVSSLILCSMRGTQSWRPMDPLKQWLDAIDPGEERIFRPSSFT